MNRLVYKPFGDSKINVAVRGSWSGAHNDHTVPYDNGGFSVMPINNLKSPYNSESVRTVFRLPKDDQYYDIWDWTKGYAIEKRVRVYINDDLIEKSSILAETSGGDHSLGLEPPEDLSVGLVTRILEVDVVPAHLSYNVLISIGLIPALVVSVDLVKA